MWSTKRLQDRVDESLSLIWLDVGSRGWWGKGSEGEERERGHYPREMVQPKVSIKVWARVMSNIILACVLEVECVSTSPHPPPICSRVDGAPVPELRSRSRVGGLSYPSRWLWITTS